ncbi:MAG TPA: hypothetical protein VFJ58_28200 [Armatimonadota bacterium]|nr:hypothetical protein [Armatimonadota bacterium]
MLALFSLFGLVYFVFVIYCIYWIYNEEDGTAGIVWGILTFFFSFIPLAVYAILNRSRTAWMLTGGWVVFWLLREIFTIMIMPAVLH